MWRFNTDRGAEGIGFVGGRKQTELDPDPIDTESVINCTWTTHALGSAWMHFDWIINKKENYEG